MGGEVRYYSVEEAARFLRLTPERVREMLEAGELDGIPTAGGERWMIPMRGDLDIPPPTPVQKVPLQAQPLADTPDVPEEEPTSPPASEATEELRQPAAAARGDDAATPPEPTSESGWVTTQQAARALGISARTVRWHIERGNLEAKPEGEGVERTWRVSVDSLQAFRNSRQAAARSPRGVRGADIGADIATADPGSAIRELADRLVEEARRAEAARVRLELSERAQSTLEAELAEERRRREEAERERDDLRRELQGTQERREEPSESAEPRPDRPGAPDAGGEPESGSERPWWRRVFGS